MDYINYGYEPHQTIQSSFNNLSLKQAEHQQVCNPAKKNDANHAIAASVQQTSSSKKSNLPHDFSSSMANSTSSYMTPPNMHDYHFQGVRGNLTAGGNGPIGKTDMNRSGSGYWLNTSSTNKILNGFNTNVGDGSSCGGDMTASPAGNVSASRNFMDSLNHNSFNTSFDTFASNDNVDSNSPVDHADILRPETVESLQLKIQLKETQNECLENEIQKLKSIFNKGLNYKQSEVKYEKQNSHIPSISLDIPSNLELVFRKLSNTLQKKEEELSDAKQTLESVFTALALSPTNSITKYGRYDAEALAHKMVVRIETLTKENQEMAKMLAYGRSKETQIELQLMKKENGELKDKIFELQQLLKNPPPLQK